MECGRYLERTENTLRIMQSFGASITGLEPRDEEAGDTYPLLQAVLRSVSGYQPFRRYYADGISQEAIVEFMVP